MDAVSSANRFIGAFFLGGVVDAVAMLLLYYAGQTVSSLAFLHGLVQILVSGAISFVILNARLLAFKTIWADRRDQFLLDEDLNAMILGRTVGIPAGAVAAIFVQLYIMA